jgi:hypothetical protein
MPPRYAYWTILIDGKATAFRAKESEELLADAEPVATEKLRRCPCGISRAESCGTRRNRLSGPQQTSAE